jgi:membrane protease YdiL (CAAX protease family)
MRWSLGTPRQLAWALTLVPLRMLVFGAMLFGVLKPLLTRDLAPRSGAPLQLVEAACLALLAIGFAVVLVRRVARASWDDLGFSRVGLRQNLLRGLALFGVNVVIVLAHARVLGLTPADAWRDVTSYSAGQRIQIILVGIHVVFGEELLFRGYLQPGLSARYSPAVAVGVTALVFALYHVDFSLNGFLGTFVWGVVWGVARERWRSTIPSSVAHFLNWSVFGWF